MSVYSKLVRGITIDATVVIETGKTGLLIDKYLWKLVRVLRLTHLQVTDFYAVFNTNSRPVLHNFREI